jgi:rubrerythrin
MVLLQVREAEHALEFQRFLHDAQENGEADGVDKLDIGKIYDELSQAVAQKLFAHLFETRRRNVIDVSPGHQDGNALLRGP